MTKPRRLPPGITQLPSGRYQYRWRDPAGKECKHTLATLEEILSFKTSVEHSKLTGNYVDQSRESRAITVAEIGERLLATKKDKRNHEWYDGLLRNHVYPRWEKVPIRAVSYLDVLEWVADLDADRGPDTVRGAFRALHEVVKLALNARLIGFDPCLDVKGLPEVDRREMLFLSPSQIALLATRIDEAFPGYGWGLMVRFAAYTGLRAGEIGGLQVKHLDVLRGRVHVLKARKATGRDGKPKTGKLRWVDVPKQLCTDLAAHLAERPHGPEDRVWTGERGGPVNHKWFYKTRYKPIVNQMSDEGLLPVLQEEDEDGEMTLRFHDLRHTCVALLIAKGAQQYEVMEHLGHTNIQTTINTYGHLFPSVRERIKVALEETWDEGEAAGAIPGRGMQRDEVAPRLRPVSPAAGR